MNIRFYKGFFKRKNSTKIPGALVDYVDKDCKLKNPTNIENPTIELSGTYTPGSATGNPVNISDAAAAPAQSLTVDFTPIQEGSGTPSPSNPRPVVGFTSINVDVNGNVTAIDLQGTKYGGTLDVLTGILTVSYVAVDLGSLTWVNNASYPNVFNGTLTPRAPSYPSIAQIPINWLCDIYESFKSDDVMNHDYGAAISQNGFTVYVKNKDYTNKDTFKNDMAGKYFCFKPFNVQVVQLTPAQVNLVKGANTITTNGDTLSITYTSYYNDFGYDYCYISEFDKYYFVRLKTVVTNKIVQYELEEDSLASKKTAIGATVAHIAYAATGWDKWLIDSRLPVKTTKNINTQVAASGLSNTGMYVVAIINDRSATKLGACTFYMMTEANMNNLAYNLSDQGIITDLRNIFNNPLDSIVKAVWIPLAPTSVPQSHYDNAELVYAGSRALNLAGHECYGAPLKDFVVELAAVSLLIPDKHQDFRDASPFTTGSLYLPGLGLTDLNMSDFIESVNVNIKTYIDITTGDITYRIYEDNGHILKTCIFNGATEIPLAHVTNNAGGTLASIGGVAGGAITAAIAGASGNLPVAFGGIATALASGTSAVMQSAMRATSIKGGIAGRSAFYDVVFKLLIVQLDTEDPDDANYVATFGRPVGVAHAISNHSGYVQCDNASVVMAGSVLERDRINDYLNTGFFYE